MTANNLNVLVSTFPGLGLAKTLTLRIPSTATISDSVSQIEQRLPSGAQSRLIITTTSNKQLLSHSQEPVTSLLASPSDDFLTLRLSAPLCGGKGGFGSQLRAAGGRMSSRKKKAQGENNGSSRNLDGRRLRTITEAKALAEYLALKPDMDKKEREERMKKWEQIIEIAEKKQEELKSGSKARLDGQWMEAKEEASEKTREAVIAALSAGEIQDVLMGSDESEDGSEDGDSSESEDAGKKETVQAESSKQAESGKRKPGTYHGWEEEEELSESDEEVETAKDGVAT